MALNSMVGQNDNEKQLSIAFNWSFLCFVSFLSAATSNGSANGIDNSNGGLCESHYMKLRVYVKPKPTGKNPL